MFCLRNYLNAFVAAVIVASQCSYSVWPGLSFDQPALAQPVEIFEYVAEESPYGVKYLRDLGDQAEKNNFDVDARAIDRQCLRFVSDWPKPNYALVNRVAIRALTRSLKQGDLVAADGYYAVLKSSLSFDRVNAAGIAEDYPPALSMLLAAGRKEEAEFLGQALEAKFLAPVEKFDPYHYYESRNRLPVLKAVAEVRIAVDADRALLAADRFGAILKEWSPDNYRDYIWLGDYYLQLKKYDRATAAYQSALTYMKKWTDEELKLSDCQHNLTYAYYNLAVAQYLLGEPAAARATLRLAESVFSLAGIDQASRENSTSAVFPTLDDVRAAIADHPYLHEKKPDRTAKWFRLLAAAYKEIDEAHHETDHKELAAAVESLVEIYGPVAATPWNERGVNYFSGLMQVARKLSDTGLYFESNKLLNEIYKVTTSNTLRTFIFVERAINCFRQKQPAEPSWTVIGKNVSSGYPSPADVFRRLAMAFYYAGEYQRAEIIMSHSWDLSNQDFSATQENSPLRATILLKYATILARVNKSGAAEDKFNQAVSLAHMFPFNSTDANPEFSRDSFNQQYRVGVLAYSQALADTGHADLSESALRQALATITTGSTNAPLDSKPNSMAAFAADNSVLKVALARILFNRKNFAAAMPLLNDGIANWNNDYGDRESLRGDCATLTGDFATAARCYLKASSPGTPSGLSISAQQPHFSENLLIKALDAAGKTDKLTRAELANMNFELGLLYQNNYERWPESMRLYQKAYELMAASPEKEALAARISDFGKMISSNAE